MGTITWHFLYHRAPALLAFNTPPIDKQTIITCIKNYIEPVLYSSRKYRRMARDGSGSCSKEFPALYHILACYYEYPLRIFCPVDFFVYTWNQNSKYQFMYTYVRENCAQQHVIVIITELSDTWKRKQKCITWVLTASYSFRLVGDHGQ